MFSDPILKRICVPATCLLVGACLLGSALIAAYGQSSAARTPAVLDIHVDKSLHSVSPTLYGMMTEEINYSYDGGLYAETGEQPDDARPQLESAGLAGGAERERGRQDGERQDDRAVRSAE